MCHLFAHQPQQDYESQTRSLRIGGHCTSIRLEMSFWDTLEEIAAKENMSLGKFLTRLHSEVLNHHGEVNNFASLLRCSCLIYRSRTTAAVPDFRGAAGPLLDAVHRRVEPQRDAGLARVPIEVLNHLVASREGRGSLRIGPARKMRELPARVELQTVVTGPP